MSTFPVVKFEVDIDNDPDTALASNTWTDFSSRLRAFSCRRGRNRQLDRAEAGTASVTLDNRDGHLSPWNTQSPYWDSSAEVNKFAATRKCRISAEWRAVTYNLFTGFVDLLPVAVSSGYGVHRDCVMTLSCTDAFETLALYEIGDFSTGGRVNYGEAASGTRIGAVLTSVGWPAADRDLATGRATIQAAELIGTPALEHMQQVAQTEVGIIFINGTGQFVFHDRLTRVESFNTIAATFGFPGGLPHSSSSAPFTAAIGNDTVVNQMKIRRVGNPSEAVASDATSISRHFRRTMTRSNVLLTNDSAGDAAATSYAEWLLYIKKDPHTYLPPLTFVGGKDGNLWPEMLGLEISDHITVQATVPGGDDFSANVYVEGIEQRVMTPIKEGLAASWITTLRVSSSYGWSAWILDDAVMGVVGVTTIPGFA